MVTTAMNSIMRIMLYAVFGLSVAAAASEGPRLQRAQIDAHDLASLQNGAKLFVNYCLNCHSAGYMRYNRLEALGLTEQQIRDNLIFTGVKVGELMQVAIDRKNAKEWFGTAPPDLTVITRSRSSGAGTGADWAYTYLRAFYRDPARPTGWNNLIFPNVAMPHALWQLNGQQQLVEEQYDSEHKMRAALIAAKSIAVVEEVSTTKEGKEVKRYVLKTLQPGTGAVSAAEYDKLVTDLVNYMDFMAEPARLERRQIGIWVLLILGVLFALAVALKQAYWKDVH